MKNLMSVSFFKHGGRHIIYKTPDEATILGSLYIAPGCKVQFRPEGGEYRKTDFYKIIDARKALIDPLLPK